MLAQVKCIVRARGSQSAEARLRAVWAGPVFRRHSIATLQDKVEVIDADLSAPQCGLSAEQQACLARYGACDISMPACGLIPPFTAGILCRDSPGSLLHSKRAAAAVDCCLHATLPWLLLKQLMKACL